VPRQPHARFIVHSGVYEWPTAEAALAGVLQRGGDIAAAHTARRAFDASYVDSLIGFTSAHDASAAPRSGHAGEAVAGHEAPKAETLLLRAAPFAAPVAAADILPRRSSSPPPRRAGGSGSGAAPSQPDASGPHPRAGNAALARDDVMRGLDRLRCTMVYHMNDIDTPVAQVRVNGFSRIHKLVWEAGSGVDTESAQTAPASGLLQAGLSCCCTLTRSTWLVLLAQAILNDAELRMAAAADAVVSSQVALDQLWRRMTSHVLVARHGVSEVRARACRAKLCACAHVMPLPP
jgi:hypothetical protein